MGGQGCGWVEWEKHARTFAVSVRYGRVWGGRGAGVGCGWCQRVGWAEVWEEGEGEGVEVGEVSGAWFGGVG